MDESFLSILFGGGGEGQNPAAPGEAAGASSGSANPIQNDASTAPRQQQQDTDDDADTAAATAAALESTNRAAEDVAAAAQQQQQQRDREHREQRQRKERAAAAEAAAAAAAAATAPRRTRQGARLGGAGSDSDGDRTSDFDVDDLSGDEDWSEVKSWDPVTLVGPLDNRSALMAMSELDREKFLAERRGRVEKMKERLEVKKMLRVRKGGPQKAKRRQAHDSDEDSDEDEHPTKRVATEKSRRATSMAHLRREREKKSAKGRSRDDSDSDYAQERGQSSKSAKSSDAVDASKSTNRDTKTGEEDVRKSLPSFEEVVSLQLKRAELAEWAFHPHLEKTAKGCFVRYGIGADTKDPSRNVYRICLIDEIKTAARPYTIDGKLVPKSAVMTHASSSRENTFAKVSNSIITDSEYQRWARTMTVEKVAFPAGAVEAKLKDLHAARTYVLSSDEVAKIVEQKKALQKVPTNLTTATSELQRQLAHAIESGDEVARAELQAQLDRLLAMLPKREAQPFATTASAQPTGVAMTGPPMAGMAGIGGLGPGAREWRPKVILMAEVTNKWDKHFAFDPALEGITPAF
ncbi:hypothetical protein HDU87_008790 [Geranomyces variabilis]|uniref:Plus3 domain-containing protein n=1 Tax=Geranomyces variabilis TaxID=109894 RepID=A0AAD5XIU7_9FUNG|nr:hypothetical protein HDU87_008790 [Geranomyces variabilis]